MSLELIIRIIVMIKYFFYSLGYHKIISFLLAILYCVSLNAQELPPIQNYSPKTYKGESQNWAVCQSSDKRIYVANNKGLLEFNGAIWKVYPSPNESILRSVKADGNRIYTGCYMEFGFWEKDDLGELKYTSLSQNLAVDLIEDEEFWNIIKIEDWIVFQSLNRIYIYDVVNASVNTVDSDHTITKIYKVDNSIYFQILTEGIFQIKNGKGFRVIDNDIVKNKEVVSITGNTNDLLILTRDDGFYKFKNNQLIKWNTKTEKLLTEVSIYNAIKTKDNSFVLGTIADGLIYLDSNGDLLHQVDQNNGLANNTVLSVFEDVDRNIWLGLDNGISYINVDSPFRIYKNNRSVLGSVYASAIYQDYLYLGTNQGLFYKELNGNEDFRFIEGTEGQVWCLHKIEGTLFCGHNNGTFTIQNNQAKKISNVQGTWNIRKLKDRPNLLLQGNYDGLYILEKTDSDWQLRNRIEGFHNSSRYFEVFGDDIFVNHEYKGVFRIQVDSSFYEVKNIHNDTTIIGSNSGLIKYNEELLYAFKEGIFKYNGQKEQFVKDSVLSKIYTEEEYTSGKLILDISNNNLWVFTKSNISFITQGTLTRTPKVSKIPFTKEERNCVTGYESAMSLKDGSSYFFGTSNGYITADINKLNVKSFKVYLENVIQQPNKKQNKTITFLNKELQGDFKSSENNLEISYYAPEYNRYLKPRYQFQLVGIYDDWSEWSEASSTLFQNLPFGDYTFNVRSKIGNKISENTASYSFSISKPWYITNLMLGIYILGIILFSIFMHTMYRQYYKRKQNELIEKNKRKLELTNIQNEKEIIRIKNEQLEKEFEGKSKELAASTIDLAKKNELLTQIKNHLTHISDQKAIKPVVDIIDENLNHNDNWEFFKEAFNNVDRKFLKKLKKHHPDLTPNDLKLCAYLRLNLSSKEIAPLFNISARSVEIKRYRLRKKLNLQHEENLVNYILQL
ncbi:triple tyrosine motif-containing protein [Aquimarina litoralis]|uniref:triple tyrosine motif-containing protein n=1 Tax=Aquimarina litoralis TaxID=584605 RepID=UPI001C588983|nr:triple tyrosine motif-containing protein [Aquimarina litoralis]MBW1295382.1 LuxR family transcriptional regulator [Aquimarina litoralis]